MPNLNLVQLMGNLTREPELKYTPKGTPIVDFGLAINHNYVTNEGEKREEVTFVDVEFWGKRAEVIAEHVKKGQPLYVQGRLKLDQWDDKATGQKRSKLRVVGEDFQFLARKGEEGGYTREREEADTQYKKPAFQGRGTPAPKPPANSDAPLDDGDDVPF